MNSVEQSVDLRSSENDLANQAVSVFRRPFCVLLHIKTKRTAVIPAQAGIQTSVFQKYLKITANLNC